MTAQLDLDDIQGLVLRGYRRMRRARHLIVGIDRPAAFKAVLRDLAKEDRASGPFVTVASDWRDKPPVGEDATHCVNVGLTYSGLQTLGVAPDSLASFPVEFREGAAHRAARVGDTGPSDPATWVGPLGPAGEAGVHVVVSLFAIDDAELTALAVEMSARLSRDDAARILLALDASVLDDDPARAGYVHFGYRDGLSQPTIAGLPQAGLEDPLEPVPAGEFILGHPGQRPFPVAVPQPAELGSNGSFAAFRIAEQDVDAFEAFLTSASDGTPEGRELLAARLCGRWRSGVALVMSPDSDSPDIPVADLNRFDYATVHPDPDGVRCPLGSHIRRVNPRLQPVMGGAGDKHRLIRRGMPYGPPHDPSHPGDGHERGLIGMFICASLRQQFEFVMKEWVNDGIFAAGLGRTRDPLTAASEPPDDELLVPGDPPQRIGGLRSFVTTRGAAYLFLPSMTALRHLAELPDAVAA